MLGIIDQLQNEVPALKEALELARRADGLEELHLYHRALTLYKEAIESLLPLIGECIHTCMCIICDQLILQVNDLFLESTEKGDARKLIASEVTIVLLYNCS